MTSGLAIRDVPEPNKDTNLSVLAGDPNTAWESYTIQERKRKIWKERWNILLNNTLIKEIKVVSISHRLCVLDVCLCGC